MSEIFYKGTNYPKRPFTKEELRELIKVWPTMSLQELAVKFQRPERAFVFVASLLRKEGVTMEKKQHGNGMSTISRLIKEVVEGR